MPKFPPYFRYQFDPIDPEKFEFLSVYVGAAGEQEAKTKVVSLLRPKYPEIVIEDLRIVCADPTYSYKSFAAHYEPVNHHLLLNVPDVSFYDPRDEDDMVIVNGTKEAHIWTLLAENGGLWLVAGKRPEPFGYVLARKPRTRKSENALVFYCN